MNEPVDLALARHLEAARQGDKEAFAHIYREFAPAVHGIVLARVGPHEVDDLVQEAFLKIYKGLATVRDARAMPGWICTVARNLATDLQRKDIRRPRNSADATQILGSLEEPVTSDGELRQRVWQRIQELPESYREPLTLRLVEGLSGPEIAARTGLKATSVRVNLCRGMAMLRPLLQKDGWS